MRLFLGLDGINIAVMDRNAETLKHLDDTVVIVGVQPPEGERFCVISRDDMLRSFGIQCWRLLVEADLRDQLKQAGMPDSSMTVSLKRRYCLYEHDRREA